MRRPVTRFWPLVLATALLVQSLGEALCAQQPGALSQDFEKNGTGVAETKPIIEELPFASSARLRAVPLTGAETLKGQDAGQANKAPEEKKSSKKKTGKSSKKRSVIKGKLRAAALVTGLVFLGAGILSFLAAEETLHEGQKGAGKFVLGGFVFGVTGYVIACRLGGACV